MNGVYRTLVSHALKERGGEIIVKQMKYKAKESTANVSILD